MIFTAQASLEVPGTSKVPGTLWFDQAVKGAGNPSGDGMILV